jgi:hypothetical protein
MKELPDGIQEDYFKVCEEFTIQPDKLKEHTKIQQHKNFNSEKLPQDRTFNRCLLTLENPYTESGFECDFDVNFFQMKADRNEYNKVVELMKARK